MKFKLARLYFIGCLMILVIEKTFCQFDSGLFAGCIYFDNEKQVEDCENRQMEDYFDAEILPFLIDIKKESVPTRYYTYFYIDQMGSVIDLEILDITKSEEQIISPVKFSELAQLTKINNLVAKEKYFAGFTYDFDKNNFLIKKYIHVVAAKDEVYKIVSLMPRFPGCEDVLDSNENYNCAVRKMLKYIYSNLEFSEEAINKKVNNSLIVQFIVEKDGYITNINLKRDFGYGCGQSAIDVVESMNHMEELWTPGLHYGREVRVKYTLPIKFDVNKVYENDDD